MGFEKLDREKIKSNVFRRNHTRILRVIKASPKVARQIGSANGMLEKFGPESFSQMGSYDVYRYRNIAMMVTGNHNLLWELGVRSTRDKDALRVIFTRYLSFAFAAEGVVGFWGVPIEEGFVVLNPKGANYESIFIDTKKNLVITYEGVKELDPEMQILRLDPSIKNEMRQMKKEQLLSFLSIHTINLSYSGLDPAMKKGIFELTQIAQGYVYPFDNFKPRMNSKEV